GARRLAQRGVPRPARPPRGHLRPPPRPVRRPRRRGHHPGARRPALRRPPRRARGGHPRHPDGRRPGRPPPRRRPPPPPAPGPPAHAEDPPDTPTTATLVAPPSAAFPRDGRRWEAADTLKNVLAVLHHPAGTKEPLAIGIPGDREVDAKRLQAQVEPAEVEPM